MPNRSDYQPLSQSADDSYDTIENSPSSSRAIRRNSRPGPIDLSKLDTAFKRWTESITQKMKGKKKKIDDHSRKEIYRSVFDPPIPPTPAAPGAVKTLDHNAPMTQSDFDAMSLSVKRAISEGVNPKMISKGSSGSYFSRAKVDGKVQTVAVFKPKDEEPYGRLNPKTTKWLHRQFRWLIPFGRSCLIPNLSYISEAAASLLDQRLELNIVPRTELVSLSSPAFFYDWLDRNAAKKGKPLPEKIGSMQCFMHGYQDSSEFLRKHPWPGRSISDTFDDSSHRTGGFTKRFLTSLQVLCGKTGNEEDMYEEDDHDDQVLFDASESDGLSRSFYWSGVLQQSFREELEKLIILDYLMRNTDRGADNYMIKVCEGEHDKQLVDVAPSRSESLQLPVMRELRTEATAQLGMTLPSSSEQTIAAPGTPSSSYLRQPHVHIAAIDNSLSFPHEHPKGWRSFTYGWLYLPVSLIGRPFSEKTRRHFLPLLTSKTWWEETTYQLRKIHAVDPDYNRKMFQRQLAVLKGQAWNIVQALKHSDEGPLELTRRQKVLVWDDEIEIEDETLSEAFNGPLSASPKPSVRTLPVLPQSHRRARSQSAGLSSNFPPPVRRTSTDVGGTPRPVPFSGRLPRIHPGTSGVTILEHMEKVDAVEAGLRRLAINEIVEEEEEEDVGMAGPSQPRSEPQAIPTQQEEHTTLNASGSLIDGDAASTPRASSIRSPKVLDDANVEDNGDVPPPQGAQSLSSSVTEEDLVAMSRSTPHMLSGAEDPNHLRWMSDQNTRQPFSIPEWGQPDESKKRIVIVERLETVNTTPLFSCW